VNDAVLNCYHRLPGPLRSAAATVRGGYLRAWRYGRDTERLIDETLERDQWSTAEWKRWQSERLAYVLERAATKVPFYRALWAKRRQAGDRAAWDVLENWPALSKDTVRDAPLAFVADDCDVKRMFHEHTSGTTGKPVQVFWSLNAVRGWYAVFEARCRRWYGVSRHDRWAMLAGQLVVPVRQQKPPFWVWNQALNQLYMSSYHLSPSFLPAYADALVRHRVTHLSGYPSSLYSLALGVLERKPADLHVRVVITNAEKLLDYQRDAISAAFNCPVCETYGMAEIVTCASECSSGSLHLWPEIGIPEQLTDRESGARTGALLGTSLLNADMPLIRYQTGDRGTVASEASHCTCGRTLPLIGGMEGRMEDMFYTLDGRRVGRLDPVFKRDLPVREAQLIQERLDLIRVRFVPAPGFTRATEREITAQLRQRLGDVEVQYEAVSQVARTSRGKFQFAVCALPAVDRERFEHGAVKALQLR
jgi:phenylacetate-CoA ligase